MRKTNEKANNLLIHTFLSIKFKSRALNRKKNKTDPFWKKNNNKKAEKTKTKTAGASHNLIKYNPYSMK